MNEHEIRHALRGVMVASSPPPPMSPEVALEAARQARRRRRAVWAAGGAALAVVAIAVGALVVPGLPRAGSGRLGPAAPSTANPTPISPEAGVPQPGTTPPAGTETVWPTGPDGKPQSDRTAYAGPRHDRAAALLDVLIASVPPGYDIPRETNKDPGSNDPDTAIRYWSRAHQAQFRERVGDLEVWEYFASLSVSRAGGTGGLQVETITAAPEQFPADGCELARTMWTEGGECEVVDVGGALVGVLTPAPSPIRDIHQLAAYRHADGTVVTVSQGLQFYESAEPPLAAPPFGTAALAALAADPRFALR